MSSISRGTLLKAQKERIWQSLGRHIPLTLTNGTVADLLEVPAGMNYIQIPRILRNETWLRNSQDKEWSNGLVLFSQHADIVFSNSKLSTEFRTLDRTPMNGFKILDRKRRLSIKVQPTVDAFSKTFDVLSDGLLRGLDWDNVFAAGGIALSSLLCTDIKSDAPNFKNSDIDLYIYGVGPIEANKKVQHIYKVWRSNLPKNAGARVARNSRTVRQPVMVAKKTDRVCEYSSDNVFRPLPDEEDSNRAQTCSRSERGPSEL